ncbi:hypothetical protein POTOM_044115 [Populus tomentosa]|uniref:TATA-box-binding protein n=1 Tax=Populus tomentosa TaxID=118781 RepID=A0A8X7YLQ1_POPTO|nr:hypothetical protein POTOM_044115 [Populus tomentosa]
MAEQGGVEGSQPVDLSKHPSGIIPTLQNIVSTVNLDCKLELKQIALQARNAEYNPKRFAAVIMRIREPKTTALIFASGKMVSYLLLKVMLTDGCILAVAFNVCTGAKSEQQSKLAARKVLPSSLRKIRLACFLLKCFYFDMILTQNLIYFLPSMLELSKSLALLPNLRTSRFRILLAPVMSSSPLDLKGLHTPMVLSQVLKDVLSVGLVLYLCSISLSCDLFMQYEPELFPGLIYRMKQPKIVLLIFVSGKIVITGAKVRDETYTAFENIYPVLTEFRKVQQ